MNKDNKKTNGIRILHFILGILILSSFGFALTTVTDNGITVSSGNVTADWFVGKINITNIQNFQYNYNQTIASSGDGSFNVTYDATTNDVVANRTSFLACFNSTYAGLISYNSTFNQTLTDSRYALTGTGGNSSFNQSLTDILYAPIIWNYNQTTASNSYADSIVNRTFNKSATDLYYSSIIWNYNQTTPAITFATNAANLSFNKSATDLYYSSIIWGYNQTTPAITYTNTVTNVSFNKSATDLYYASITFGYNMSTPAIAVANTKAATGNCAAGFVVQNTTTSGVQCVPASTSTTNDGITINGANITAGTINFDRLPSLVDRLTLNIANITGFAYNYNQTSLANTYTDGRGFITSTNVAYTNISNSFARSQNVSGNVTIRSGDNVCLDGDACTKKIYWNNSNLIIQG